MGKIISKDVQDYGKDLAIYSTGALTGMAVDTAVANVFAGTALPGIGTLKIDDLLLLAGEGILGYYLRKKGHKDSSNFVIGMFGATLMIEVGEAIISAMTQAVRAAGAGQARIAATTQTTRYIIS